MFGHGEIGRDDGPRRVMKERATHESPVPAGAKAGSVGAIVGSFKSATTKRINVLREMPGAAIWHRNYYEHVICDAKSLDRNRRYIVENPARWASDRGNPQTVEPELEDAWMRI